MLLPDTPEYRRAQRQHKKATKNRPPTIDQEWTPFRAAEKRFKARFPPPDLSPVLDLACRDKSRANELEAGGWRGSADAVECLEIPPTSQAGNTIAYHFPTIPGLVLLPSFVSKEKQRELVIWALSRHARQPHDTNLDTHYFLPENGLWNSARVDSQKEVLVLPRASETTDIETPSPGPRRLVNNTPASPENFQSISTTPKPSQAPSPSVQPALASSLLYKLRWANIGWFYHWGTKQYDFSKGKGTIDGELRRICKAAVRSVDWTKVHGSNDDGWGPEGPDWRTWDETYEPDAGIVNFYQEKASCPPPGQNTDPKYAQPPLWSPSRKLSLGNAAVFLIGGLTRDSEPTPILLRSGDVVIMSGPACRRAYHGVPRILEGTLPGHLESRRVEDKLMAKEWEPYEAYMKTTRININVRQVFPKGFDPYVNAI
ncbi:hypothetical protein NLJ89_g7819 [Agrocybe chaxingu]|uniref:Alpha-ketoglutarate-dependent dioxygenase AlkB-like domain-containing protein n=1 Tax=Agrocybe chaxingu TaxID=84603 RepID=A0A9W8JWF3_9AGAR|nr:hypothetical protein NLJ89_g7819 [Agrocybe chaxingu]